VTAALAASVRAAGPEGMIFAAALVATVTAGPPVLRLLLRAALVLLFVAGVLPSWEELL
jgi:hypothetical protein